MSLSQDPAFSMLRDEFVVGWKNIMGEDYVGSSHGYECDDVAVGTTNGAGPRNMQMFVLSSDGVVMHCLPGFWHPDDLVVELRHAKVLHRLWKDKRSKKSKRDLWRRIHLAAVNRHPTAMVRRSGWQGFDAKNERMRLKHGTRDTFYYKNGKPGKMKPLSVLVHERIAARPFVRFSRFDTDAFIDYGRPYYDNNKGGVQFGGKGFMESQKRMAAKRAERAERKRKVDEYYGKKPKATKKGRRTRSKRRDEKAAPQKPC